VAAILATEKAAQGIGPGSHGSTFGGNPLAMAVANAVLDVMLEDGFLANVRVQGEALQRRVGALVAAAPKVADAVRGLGLLVGIHCVAPAGEVVAALRAEGLLTVPAADNVVRLLPPLIVGGAELDAACGMIESAFAKLSS
jgi:acetylornithine/N-succinyldiaminopimelate aminotransferase